MLLFFSLLLGVSLGLTCNIFALLPVFLLSFAGLLGNSLLTGQPFWSGVLSCVFPAICLQAGYMIGLTGRDTLAQLRLRGEATKRI